MRQLRCLHQLLRRGLAFRRLSSPFSPSNAENRAPSAYVRGFVSRPVRETLALDTLEGRCRTFPIRHPIPLGSAANGLR